MADVYCPMRLGANLIWSIGLSWSQLKQTPRLQGVLKFQSSSWIMMLRMLMLFGPENGMKIEYGDM